MTAQIRVGEWLQYFVPQHGGSLLFGENGSTRGSRASDANGAVRLLGVFSGVDGKVLILSSLAAGLLALAACGGEQAGPPAGTQVPDEPNVTVSMSPTLEPPAGPSPTPDGMDTPVPEPTATPAIKSTAKPTPTVETTAVPTPIPAPAPAIGGLDKTVTSRDMEYDYTIELPDSWRREGTGTYTSTSPWGRVGISSQYLPREYTVDQFTQLILYDLRNDWWPNAALFEVTSIEESMKGEQPARLIRYRVQEAPEYCVVDVDELVAVSRILSGNPHGFRVKAWMCEHDVGRHGETREQILESFQVTTGPAEYYRQFMSANGVTVKADGTVEPAAVEAGAEVAAAMLSGRDDIVRCMARERAELAIIPRDRTLTSLPEYAYLKGTKDFTGRGRDTFEIRGVGAVLGQPVSSAAEEQVLGRFGPRHPYYPYRGLVAVHELAHGIQNLCFTAEDHEEWNGFYGEAVRADLYPGTHMMYDANEFFAVFSTAYFEVTDELGQTSDRDTLKKQFPEVFLALDEIYGGATLPMAFSVRRSATPSFLTMISLGTSGISVSSCLGLPLRRCGQ